MTSITLPVGNIVGIITLLFAAIAAWIAIVQIFFPGHSSPTIRYTIGGIFVVVTVFAFVVGVYLLVLAGSPSPPQAVANFSESTPTEQEVIAANTLTLMPPTSTQILPTDTPMSSPPTSTTTPVPALIAKPTPVPPILPTNTSTLSPTPTPRPTNTPTPTATSRPVVFVSNSLRLAVSLYIDDIYKSDLGPSDIETVYLDSPPVDLRWEIVKATTKGGKPTGDEMSGTWKAVGGEAFETKFIDNIVEEETYFYPLVSNESSYGCEFSVNDGYPTENRPGAEVPAHTSRVVLGYYRLYENSNVTLYCDDGTIHWFGVRTQEGVEEGTSFIDSVEADDGYIHFTYILTPTPTLMPSPTKTNTPQPTPTYIQAWLERCGEGDLAERETRVVSEGTFVIGDITIDEEIYYDVGGGEDEGTVAYFERPGTVYAQWPAACYTGHKGLIEEAVQQQFRDGCDDSGCTRVRTVIVIKGARPVVDYRYR